MADDEFSLKVTSHVTIRKYRDGEDFPYEQYEDHGNLLMYGGASAIWERLKGTGVTAFDNTNAYLGVGTSTTAAAATQTDLQGTNARETMDSTFPTHTDGTSSTNATITYQASYETGDANFAWNEWGLFNASSSGRMLNRKVFSPSPGTKTSADTWVLSVAITAA